MGEVGSGSGVGGGALQGRGGGGWNVRGLAGVGGRDGGWLLAGGGWAGGDGVEMSDGTWGSASMTVTVVE